MGYLRAGFVVLAVLGGIAGAAGSATAATVANPAATKSPAPASSPDATGTSTSTPTSPPTPTPSALSQSPVLIQQPDGSWITTIYVNTAALSPLPPTYALVTTNPDAAINGQPSTSVACAQANLDNAPGVTPVCLGFMPQQGQLPAAPVSAAVVMTPATGVPVTVPVTVHRTVTAMQYFWWPVICGGVLAGLLIVTMSVWGVPDPNGPGGRNGRPRRVRGARLWKRQIYAGGAWSFSGSWATNVTTVATVVTAVLAATGTVGELLPGVETGRFSLLLALAGVVTLAAPLLFGALNYRFERVDPTSTGAAMVTLPTGQQNQQERPCCKIAVPTGAKMTVFGAATIAASAGQEAQPPPDFIEPDFIKLPADQVIVHSGATLTVPAGGTITVEPKASAATPPCLSMPGTADIVLSAGLTVTVDPWVIMDAKDVRLDTKAARAFGLRRKAKNPASPDSAHVTYAAYATRAIELAGNAKISVLGTASLGFPAGTVIAAPRLQQPEAPGDGQQSPYRTSSLTEWTVFPLPRTGEVVASRMWALLVASFLTLLGTGAEIGILGVLAFCLSTADLLIRTCCVIFLAVAAVGVLIYSVTSFLALADPTPGDALSSASSSSFLL